MIGRTIKYLMISCGFLILQSSVMAQQSEYAKKIIWERKEKDRTFRKSKESPIPVGERRRFKGLVYYPVDSVFRVTATLIRDSTQQAFPMKTSTARLPLYRKYGELHFVVKGQKCKLSVFQSQELMRNPMYRDYLFLPFTDTTTDETTYGAGRYLDLRIPKTDTIVIDFNLAYNPYCAYNDVYSCPITPAENQLPIAIEAGEKLYKVLP